VAIRHNGLRQIFFTFPHDARWNEEHQAIEFVVEIGEYPGRGASAAAGVPALS
jgi:hypothetical protein